MDAITFASTIALFTLVIIAVVEDVRFMRIRNRLILIGLVLGLAFRILEEGSQGVISYAIGVIFPVILLFLLFLARILGAGDIKLFSMIGGFVPLEQLIVCVGCSFLAGGILAFILLFVRGYALQRSTEGIRYMGQVAFGQLGEYEGRKKKEHLMHFSVAILLGLLITKGGFI